MTLVEEIGAAMDKAGREAEYVAARNLLMSAEDGPERQEGMVYLATRLELGMYADVGISVENL